MTTRGNSSPLILPYPVYLCEFPPFTHAWAVHVVACVPGRIAVVGGSRTAPTDVRTRCGGLTGIDRMMARG